MSEASGVEWSHRPALDGVRTLAVYLVVAFHAGVGGVSGGYLGVDLFFVLSGLLVTSILLDELDRTGRIRMWRFYGRRVRRLLPAAVVVVVATSALLLLTSTIVQRLPWVRDGQSALLYAANWRFLLQSDDYFAADVDQSPFLHFWSLSIEEQYYVAFPLVLVALAWVGRRRATVVAAGLFALLLLSIGAQVAWARVDPTHAYYGTDARLYQLLAGSVAAVGWRAARLRSARAGAAGTRRRGMPGPTSARRRWPRWLPGAASLLLVAYVVLATDLTDPLVAWTPSARGLVATALAVALLLLVLTERDGVAAWVLTRRPVTYLGRISYGTYLWHWPVTLLLGAVFDVPAWLLAVLAGLTATAFAALSFEVVERPIRFSAGLGRRSGALSVGAGVTASVLVAAFIVPAVLERDTVPVLTATASGSPVTVSTEANDEQRVERDLDYYRQVIADKGIGRSCTVEDQTSCVVAEGDSGLTVALVGDSHARQLAPTMQALAEEHDVTLVLATIGGCPWQLGVLVANDSNEGVEGGRTEDCLASRETLYRTLLDSLDVDVVLLSQTPRDYDRWPQDLRSADAFTEVSPDILDLNLRTITETVETIHDAGPRIIIMRSWLRPDFTDGPEDPLSCLSGARFASECRVPAPKDSHFTDAVYDTLAETVDDVTTVDINPIMCPAWPVCEALEGDVPVWRDFGHYSNDALLLHRDEIWDELAATGYLDGAS